MISLNPILPIQIVVSILLILVAFFVWQEWKRKQSLRALRIVAVCVMMIALAGIFLQPAYEIEKSSSAILLTANYNQKQVDSLIQINNNATLKHIDGLKSHRGSKPLSYSELPELQNDIQFVVGEGLPTHALDQLTRPGFQFIPSLQPEGITQLYVDESISANRTNTIKGRYYTKSSNTGITLKGAGVKEDSILLDKIGEQPFQLSFRPKQSGNVSYEITVKKGDGTTSTEILPLYVEESKPLRILFLQSYPTFETQYLKNFLASKGHQLILRFQLSKNNFRFEYGNLPSQPFSRLNRELLERFDLVMLDANELKTLSTTEQAILHEAIRNGLGLMMMNADPSKETKINLFPFQADKTKNDTTSLVLSKTSVTLSASPYRIDESSIVKSIIKNKSGVLAGYKNQGLGKIGFQFLQQTYQLTLAGDSLTYSNLWSPIIETISRSNASLSKIKITTPFPIYQDESIAFEIISSSENPILIADSIQTPLQEDVAFDDVWHARVWASEPGWHIAQLHDASLYYYVSKPEEWKPLSVANQIKSNLLASSASATKSSDKIMESKRIDAVYFYLLFILTAGFLWLAPKL